MAEISLEDENRPFLLRTVSPLASRSVSQKLSYLDFKEKLMTELVLMREWLAAFNTYSELWNHLYYEGGQ